MRKLIVILICSFLSLNTVSAQISTGEKHQSDEFKSNFSLSVRPQLFLPTGFLSSVYFPGGGLSVQIMKNMSNNLSICATGEYSLARGKGYQYFINSYEALSPSHFLNLSFGPKYYLLSGNFRPTISAGVGFLHLIHGKERSTDPYSGYESGYYGSTSFSVNIGGGIDYGINKKLSASLSALYNAYFTRALNKSPNNYMTFQMGMNYNLK
jgi:hypothetical protein